MSWLHLVGRRCRRRALVMTLAFVFVTSAYLTLQPLVRMHLDVRPAPTAAAVASRAYGARGQGHGQGHKHRSTFEPAALALSGDSQSCILPRLELWNAEMAGYFATPEPLRCHQAEENWVYTENGTFRLSAHATRNHGNVWCDFAPVVLQADSEVFVSPHAHSFADGTPLTDDFCLTRCVSSKGAVYKNLHSGIAPRKDVFDRAAKAAAVMTSSKGSAGGAAVDPAAGAAVGAAAGASGGGGNGAGGGDNKSGIRNPIRPPMNVLIFGFDSVSRMTWMRNLPKSHEFLTGELGGVVLEGYNIVGDGTPQALLPILTGRTEEELPEARRGFPNASTVDGHPWLWKDFSARGYATQWGEDGASFGTFNFRMLGFETQPVDHYMRPYYLMAEKNLYGLNQQYCMGSVPRHLNMLQWVRQFFQVYKDVPKFSFLFHSEFSHEGMSTLRLADDDLRHFLQSMRAEGFLDNTLLVLMSDHGARFQNVRQTEQGKYEERMPYFSFRFPPAFQEEHPRLMRNLKTNVHRLTTPFDVHETLREVLEPSGGRMGDTRNRGISLLKEIPVNRTCELSGIAPHWCTCHDWIETPVADRHVIASAEAVVNVINEMTSGVRTECRSLALRDVITAVKYYPNQEMLRFKKSVDTHGRVPDMSDNMGAGHELYMVTLETKPGAGRYEATVKHMLNSNAKPQYVVDKKEISRVNKYGRQPHCVMDKLPHLRAYCYCQVQLDSTS